MKSVAKLPGDAERADETASRRLASLLRPELPSLAEEIIEAIRREIPEYARPMDGPYGHALRVGVHQALTTFVDLVANPVTSPQKRDEICRTLGKLEASEGRDMATLQKAYRIGCRVAWRRVMRLGESADLPSATISRLADAVFGYSDELARLSVQGYQQARSRTRDGFRLRHRRLLRLILDQPQAPAEAINHEAFLARWPVPERVTVVVAEPGTRYEPASDDDDGVLSDFTAGEPRLLLPGEPDPGRLGEIERALSGGRAAAGLTVPLSAAADSQRWARRALELARAGVIGDAGLIRCADHVLELLLLADRALVERAAVELFEPLADMSPKRRETVIETLDLLLSTSGPATELAARLCVHAQTIRNWTRQVEAIFGRELLADPDTRLTMEFVLRATRLLKPGQHLRDHVATSGASRGTGASQVRAYPGDGP